MMRLINFICLFVFAISVFAQSLVHTVQPGETLESIAKKYNISVYKIQQANPDSQNYFYIGMKLNIPDKGESRSKEETQAVVSSHKLVEDAQSENSNLTNKHHHEFELGIGAPPLVFGWANVFSYNESALSPININMQYMYNVSKHFSVG